MESIRDYAERVVPEGQRPAFALGALFGQIASGRALAADLRVQGLNTTADSLDRHLDEAERLVEFSAALFEATQQETQPRGSSAGSQEEGNGVRSTSSIPDFARNW